MNFILKKDINTNSLVLQHKILTQTITLLSGREEALRTEKEIYLMMALIDNIIENDLIEECNNDERLLNDIIEQEIEPFFLELVKKDDNYLILFTKVEKGLDEYCKKVYDEQHSFIGLMEGIITAIETMSVSDTTGIMEGVAKLAREAYDNRTEQIQEQLAAISENLKTAESK